MATKRKTTKAKAKKPTAREAAYLRAINDLARTLHVVASTLDRLAIVTSHIPQVLAALDMAEKALTRVGYGGRR